MSNRRILLAALACVAGTGLTASADVIVDYVIDAGGNNTDPLNGLAARGTFSVDGMTLRILLENTSTDVPVGFEAADSLLVSLGFNLPDDVQFQNGDSAIIGPDSVGLVGWSDRGPGDSVGDDWIWTNNSGGDLLESFAQVLSTSSGHPGTLTRFDVGSGSIDGPWGGIAADPVLRDIPDDRFAVSDSIEFTLTLTGAISETELRSLAEASQVEFGSDARYLRTPEPGALVLLAAGALLPLSHRLRRRVASSTA